MVEGGGLKKKKERALASRELDEDNEPPKKDWGEIISDLKMRLRKNEGWTLDRDATPPSSPKLQLTSDKQCCGAGAARSHTF